MKALLKSIDWYLTSQIAMFSSCLTYFLFCWISFLIAHSLPIDSNQTNNSDEEDTLVLNVLWTSIKRHSNRTDVIRPSLCPSPCKRLFKARRVEQPVLGMDDREPSQEELCYCRCPTESPIFSQYSGQCVSKLGNLFINRLLWNGVDNLTIFRRLQKANPSSKRSSWSKLTMGSGCFIV